MEDFVHELECPVCLLTPRQPPVYICPLGHNICQECRPKLSRCPICKEKFKEGSRNYFAEKILEKLERNCRYEIFQCDFSTCDSQHLIDHEIVCDKKQDMEDLLKQEEKSDEENENDQANQNVAPVMLNLIIEYDFRPMQHYSAFTVVFLRAFIHEVCYKLNVWCELALLFLLILIIALRKTQMFRGLIEDVQPDAFNNQMHPLRNNLRFLVFRVSNQYFQCLVYWVMFVIWVIALLKVSQISHTYDNQSQIAFYVYKARMEILKPVLVLVTCLVAVLYHVIFEWNRLVRQRLFSGLSMMIIPVVMLVNLELFKDVGSDLNEGQSFLELSYCLIFWVQVVFLPSSHGRVCFPLLQLLGVVSLMFYLYDTFLNENRHNVDFDDLYKTAFEDGYFWNKIEKEAAMRSKDEIEKLKFDILVTQEKLKNMKKKLSGFA